MPDHTNRGVQCKHIFAVEFSLKLRNEVENQVVIAPVCVQTCPCCTSDKIVKHGIRRNKSGDIQRFYCNACGKWLVINIGFERMKHNPQGITTAMQLYFSGESLRNTARSLKLIDMDVTHQTEYNWISKYVNLMKEYTEKLNPNVSDTWRADELYLKVKGDMKYLFALMDDETRFWIAQEVADTKYRHDARNIFRKGKELMGKKPRTIITDGLPAYRDAYKKEFLDTT